MLTGMHKIGERGVEISLGGEIRRDGKPVVVHRIEGSRGSIVMMDDAELRSLRDLLNRHFSEPEGGPSDEASQEQT